MGTVRVGFPFPRAGRSGDGPARRRGRLRTAAAAAVAVAAAVTAVPAVGAARVASASTTPPSATTGVPRHRVTGKPPKGTTAGPASHATFGASSLANPPANVPPNPNFLASCSSTSYDDSPGCVTATLQAIDNARAQEGVPAMVLPSDWGSLTPSEQLFVATNLERTARGLAPFSAMATALDAAATAAAQQSEDPAPPEGFPWSEWGGNWGGVLGNPLEAMYFWMYDDGLGSPNVACTTSNQSGCWGHRDNVLMQLACQPCLMGAGYDGTGFDGYPSWAELLVETWGSPQLDFWWSQVTPFLDAPWSAPGGEPDLVTDPTFEESLGPWQVSPGQNWAVYQSASAPVSGEYLETNEGTSPSPSLYQDAFAVPKAGHSYRASVDLRSPTGAPIEIALVLWALGGTTEVGQSDITVSSSVWTRYATDLDVADPGHSGLRMQLYFSGTANLDVDGTMVQDAGVADAGFTQGLGSWGVTPGQNWATYAATASPVGVDYLETNAGSAASPSLYQDVAEQPGVGHTYQASVSLRSPTGAPVAVALVLWALGGTTEVGQSDFTVSSSAWTRDATDLDIADPGHSDLRMQLEFSGAADLDVGAAALEDTGVPDAAFDQPGLGPWAVTPGANWANGSGPDGPSGSGQDWLLTNTGDLSTSSVYQDISTTPVDGHPYTATLEIRSFGSPVEVDLVLWALGGPNPTEVAQTIASATSSWEPVSTELDIAAADHSDLRLQLYVDTPDQTIGITQAALPDVGAD